MGGGLPFGKKWDLIPHTDITFDNVAGIDEVRDELMEIVSFLKSPTRFEEAGASLPRGCLLSGPPGVGKTLLAKAIAGEAGLPFISTSASEFVELFVGLGASRIRDLFKTARQQEGGCIIFIDEIDAIGKARASGGISTGGNDEREQTLNQILLEMDGFDKGNVVVLAATNRPDVLDPALLRPGRFDRKIEVQLPNKEGRRMILDVHSKGKNLGDVDLDEVARIAVGASGADLANFMNEAAIISLRNNREAIAMEDIDEAISKVTIGLRRSTVYSAAEQRLVAYHEAGHALMGYLLFGPDKLQKITIIPRGRSGGVTIFEPLDQELQIYSKSYLEKQMMVALGGTIAEEITFGANAITTGATQDLKVINDIARRMVTEYGMGAWGKVTLTDEASIQGQVHNIIEDIFTKALTILSGNQNELDMLAVALINEETLTGEDVKRILGYGQSCPIKQE